MAYGGPDDLEWEEVEEDDWEVLCVEPGEQAQGGASKNGIEFTMEEVGESPARFRKSRK